MKEHYKAIVIADVHMSNKLPYSKPAGDSGESDRFIDQIKLWEQVRLAVQKHSVDIVWILGDLFDKSNVDPITLKHTVRAIMDLDCEVAILPGNHDASMATGGSYIVEAFSEMGRNDVYCFSETIEMNYIRPWLRLGAVPFCPSERAMGVIRGYQDQIAAMREPGYNVLLLHHSILGCQHLGWTCDQGLDSELICEGFDRVLAGHFHDTQTFGAHEQGMYLGAPMHHTFADASRKSQPAFWLFDFAYDKEAKKGKVTQKRILTDTPRFAIVEHNLDTGEHGGVWTRDYEKGDYVRVEVKGTKRQWAEHKAKITSDLSDIKERGVHATVRFTPIVKSKSRLKVSHSPLSASESVDGYIGKYVKAALGGEASKSEAKELTKIGLEILEEARNAD